MSKENDVFFFFFFSFLLLLFVPADLDPREKWRESVCENWFTFLLLDYNRRFVGRFQRGKKNIATITRKKGRKKFWNEKRERKNNEIFKRERSDNFATFRRVARWNYCFPNRRSLRREVGPDSETARIRYLDGNKRQSDRGNYSGRRALCGEWKRAEFQVPRGTRPRANEAVIRKLAVSREGLRDASLEIFIRKILHEFSPRRQPFVLPCDFLLGETMPGDARCDAEEFKGSGKL